MPNPEDLNGSVKEDDQQDSSLPNSPERDVHFEPIIHLPIVEVSNNEEDEIEMIKLRAKLFRYDTTDGTPEWKERGTGEVKLLRHEFKNSVRVVMRRDKTLKICANHFVWPWMELKANCGSERAWVWSTFADFADEQPKAQLLAIRFANAENAKLWKETFEKAKRIVQTQCEAYTGKPNSNDEDDSEEEEEEDSCSEDEESEVKIIISEVVEDNKDEEKDTNEVTENLEKLEVKE